MTAKQEPAWDVNFYEPGLRIWRINKFRLDSVGLASRLPNINTLQTVQDEVFHTGDSYVLLKTNQKGNEYSYNIHFWLGDQTSQDEAGTAAYKAVELDTRLGGKAVQFRELQGCESDVFLSYFKGGVRYADGGNESGFHHVVKLDYPTLLYWIHDNQVKQIPLVVDGVTEDDVFVLDCGDRILVYRGQKATHKEAINAEYEALNIKSQRPSAKIEHVESLAQKQEFLGIIGSRTSAILETKFYKIQDDGATTIMTDDHNLSSDDSYIYSVGNTTWIWVGSRSSYAEANKAWRVAIKLTKPTDRLQLIRETYEPESFWLSFSKL